MSNQSETQAQVQHLNQSLLQLTRQTRELREDERWLMDALRNTSDAEESQTLMTALNIVKGEITKGRTMMRQGAGILSDWHRQAAQAADEALRQAEAEAQEGGGDGGE